MRFWWSTTLVMASALVAVSNAAAQSSAELGPELDFSAEIERKLDLEVWSIQQLDVRTPRDGGGFDVELRLGGQNFQLGFHPYSLRSPNCKFVDDDQVEFVPPPPATYRGEVFDEESEQALGRCVGSSWDDQLRAVVRFEGHSDVWGIQHLSDVFPDYVGPAHIVYHDLDVRPPEGRCGVDDPKKWSPHGSDFGGGEISDTGDRICEIAIDCDSAYYNWAGGGRIKTIRNAEQLMLEVEERYEDPANSVDITYELTHMIVRKNPGPYTSNNAGTLLDQFRNTWNSNFQNVQRDVAHLLTGRNLDGSVIGLAWLAVICDSVSNGNGYGLSQTNFSSNIVSRAGLTAHELGHNWAAGHCDGDSDCGIMCSGLGGCSGNLLNFGNRAQGAIRSHRNSRGCLDIERGPPTLPFFVDFETGDHDDDQWSWWKGTRVTTGGDNEVSGIYSLRMNAAGADVRDQDEIRSHQFDLTADSQGQICLWVEVQGAESGERIKIDYYNRAKRWRNIGRVISNGTSESVYTQYCFDLRDSAFHDHFRFRIYTKADQTNDNFWVDDVSVTSSTLLRDDGDDEPVGGGGPGVQTASAGGRIGPSGQGAGGGAPRPRKLRIIGGPANTTILLYASVDGIVQRPFDPHSGELQLAGSPVLVGTATTDHNGHAEVAVVLPRTGAIHGRVAVQGLILGSRVETTNAHELR